MRSNHTQVTRYAVALASLLATLGTGPDPVEAQVGPPETDTIRSDSTVYRVEGIFVSAARPVTNVGGASAIELRVSDLVLPPAPTTAELLRELPALHLRTNSRGEAEISVRGSESRQVAVLLDGVPLTLGWDARTDVSVFPAGAVTDVAFTRGLGSMLQGPNVLGGVVEMSLGARRLGIQPSVRASIGADDRGSVSGSALGERPIDDLFGLGGDATMRIGIGWTDSPGVPLADGVREPVSVEDDLRLNTDVRNLSGFLALRWQGDGSAAGPGPWASMSASSFRAERGIAAELGTVDPRLWRYPEMSRTVVALAGGTGFHETPLGRGDLEVSLGFDLGTTEIESYATRAYSQITGIERGDDRTTTLRLTGDHTLGSRGDLAAAFTLSRIARDETVDAAVLRFEQQLSSLAAETRWRLVERSRGPIRSLRASVGGAWDRGRTPRTGGRPSVGTIDAWGGRIGLSALLGDGRTLLHAGLSRRGRFPSLRESYSEALDRFVPNPDLRPERLVAFEAGVTSRIGSGEIQIVGFRHDLSGAIRRITLEDRRRQRVNAGALDSRGIELLFNQSTSIGDFGGDLILQSLELLEPGSALSIEPENVPERAARLWLQREVLAGVSMRAEARYTGTQFCQDLDSGTDVELEDGTWWSALLRRDFGGGARSFEVTARVDNLTDVAIYDQCGLPRPGRLFGVQLQIR